MYVTLDDYYPVQFYNEALEALKNNKIEPKEFISIKPPFNWYIDVPSKPIMVNYDELSNTEERWIVNKVQALRDNEEYRLQRRDDDVGSKAILKYTENAPLKEARGANYAVFFHIQSKELMEQITKDMPVKIYFMGKYYKNKFRVGLCTNKMILNYISKSDILLEKEGGEHKEPGRFEAELNFKIFRGNDMLEKYTETPYFKGGSFHDVSIKGDRNVSQRLRI